ncbi:MAG: fructosamine kinase family protein [Azonexus sp.]|jgi:fructosamine-3-kinase|nr:fructosamine kinase family protein [Azonexus sp.]
MPRRFTKSAAASDLSRLLAEQAGLAALRASGAIRVPEVYACGLVDGRAALASEFLDLRGLDRASGSRLGEQLAALHRHLGPAFGFAQDNWIGGSPQQNGWHDEWPHFFAQRRLRPQFQWAAARGMAQKLAAEGETLIERLAGLFTDYRPPPSLLHGDLWNGNTAALPDGAPVIFDPAVYYGDRETDLAMMELFGGFPDACFAAYRAAWPLAPGYQTRRTLYQLYHVLNHYNLFGGGYLGQARRMTEKLLAELRG